MSTAPLADMMQMVQQGKLMPEGQAGPGQADRRVGDQPLQRQQGPGQGRTEKKRAEAEALLKQVIDRHPDTPWADLAQTGTRPRLRLPLSEWTHDPRYGERAKLVPKY